MSIRILLVDDHSLVRKGLRSILEREPTFEIVGEADNGRSAVEFACDLSPDVVVMDVSLPDLNGPLATRQIVAKCAHARIVAVSVHSDFGHIASMLRAGALAYLSKTCDIDELLRAVKAAAAGQYHLSPEITGEMIRNFVCSAEEPGRRTHQALTPREQEVLQLLAEGKMTKEIARTLRLSVKTVTTHRQNIMGKLGIRSVAELTKHAIRSGLISLDSY